MNLQNLSVLAVVSLTACACIEVPNTKTCAVAGSLMAGGICAETLTGKTSDMTFDEFVTFLEPQTGATPRPGAICQSADDWNAQKTVLEQACRMLGARCTYAMQKTIEAMGRMP